MNTLKVILYFSIFKYPLTLEEIYTFSSAKSLEETKSEIDDLIEKKIIFQLGDYYTDINDFSVVNRRKKGNKMALAIMPKAYKRAKLIMQFPFVKSVSISGSLSKNFYDDDGDIDFFIITKPNYLWLSRSLLIAYKKLVLLNSKKHFCVNYFISSNQLLIKEQNKFTATELVTLLPIFGETTFKRFLTTNSWSKTFYPNKTIDFSHVKPDVRKPLWSKTLQFLLKNKVGRRLDVYLKELTIAKWQAKFKHLEKRDFNVAMKSTNDVSKHHPQDFQSKVITKLNQKYTESNTTHKLNLKLENA